MKFENRRKFSARIAIDDGTGIETEQNVAISDIYDVLAIFRNSDGQKITLQDGTPLFTVEQRRHLSKTIEILLLGYYSMSSQTSASNVPKSSLDNAMDALSSLEKVALETGKSPSEIFKQLISLGMK